MKASALSPRGAAAPGRRDAHESASQRSRSDDERPQVLERQVLTDYARGQALVHAGRLAAAREALAAAFARVDADEPFPGREQLHARLLSDQLDVAAAMGDREAAMRWVDRILANSETPYLTLEQLQSNAALTRLFGTEVWDSLRAEIVATRP
ncbi:hypothetical protein [Nannocystis sp. SCPEA4]|uniref:hypothetical protein n=1 Tax=Nannocystis sp. SCPEA4 TaxID=2996787 RepID=UPI00226F6EC5|nr:hypothetical protein [Nannocystis sp. SCPEA4]MCY1056385.1 hypothetical protein [Nannocystis sp. SCPEA4]